jgi:hypothetical protein
MLRLPRGAGERQARRMEKVEVTAERIWTNWRRWPSASLSFVRLIRFFRSRIALSMEAW